MPTTLAALAAALLLSACLPGGQSEDDEGYPDGCHYDCPTGYTCENGVVTMSAATYVPCEHGGAEACGREELGACSEGCAVSHANAREVPNGDDDWKYLCVRGSSMSDARDAGDTVDTDTTNTCHIDCFGGYECEAGTVYSVANGPVPCGTENACRLDQLGTCTNGCATGYLHGANDVGTDPWRAICNDDTADAGDAADTAADGIGQ